MNIDFDSYTEAQELKCVLEMGDVGDPLMSIELLVLRNDRAGLPFHLARATRLPSIGGGGGGGVLRFLGKPL